MQIGLIFVASIAAASVQAQTLSDADFYAALIDKTKTLPAEYADVLIESENAISNLQGITTFETPITFQLEPIQNSQDQSFVGTQEVAKLKRGTNRCIRNTLTVKGIIHSHPSADPTYEIQSIQIAAEPPVPCV